jgi:hypothetical protein
MPKRLRSRRRGLCSLRFTMLFDVSGLPGRRSLEGEVNVAAPAEDDAQSEGKENSADDGEAGDDEQHTTGQSTQHVKAKGCGVALPYSVRNAIVGSMLSARRVGTRHASMQTPSMTIP